jgi:hypothetical protein
VTPAAPQHRLSAFKIAFWLALTYVAVLGLVATFPSRSVSRVSAQPSATPAAAPNQYAVCGIDRTSDPRTGRCVPVAATPLPCVQGSNFDAKAGFCMPVAASPPPAPPPVVVQQPADPFAGLPGIRKEPAEPQDPFWNDPSQP